MCHDSLSHCLWNWNEMNASYYLDVSRLSMEYAMDKNNEIII